MDSVGVEEEVEHLDREVEVVGSLVRLEEEAEAKIIKASETRDTRATGEAKIGTVGTLLLQGVEVIEVRDEVPGPQVLLNLTPLTSLPSRLFRTAGSAEDSRSSHICG